MNMRSFRSLRVVGSAAITAVAVSLATMAGGLVLSQQWSPINPPLHRASHSAVLDANTNTMVVFGGLPQSSPSNLDDVWLLTDADGPGLSWLQAEPTGTRPSGRFWHSAVYDSATNRMIVFGGALGRSSPCANDVWVLDHATGVGGTPNWIQLSPSGSAPAPRAAHSATYDPNTNTMIVYGGNNCFSTDFGDVWVLSHANGLGGTPAWTQLSPAGSLPTARYVTVGAYDPGSNRMVIYGGESSGSFLSDLWVLSNANGTGGTPAWIELSPTGTAPGPLADAAATYDATNNRMTIFGGFNGTAGVNNTWVLSGANGVGGMAAWMQLSPAHPPSARGGHTAVYNPSNNKMTIFGGSLSSGTYLNSVVVLSHANGFSVDSSEKQQ